MNYTKNECNNQIESKVEISNPQEGVLVIPSYLKGFYNTSTTNKKLNDKTVIIYEGYVLPTKEDEICKCGCKMHIHETNTCKIRHLPHGNSFSIIDITYHQFFCPKCGNTKMQTIPFKDENHFISLQVRNYIESLLQTGNYTNKEISFITGVSRNIVKEIDKQRLLDKYTIKNDDGTISLIKPEEQAKYLAIDEFKLHDGYKFATHIIDLETGHILWIAEGKKKQVVYDFIAHVGSDWMKNVIAVGCDMNSDFEEAFKEKCPNIKIVYDRFHIVKHLNETIGEIRKEEQERLKSEGDMEGYKSLKKSRYILTSSMETLERKDKEVEENKVISKGNELFKKADVIRKGKYRERYETIINNNEPLLVTELLKELLTEAYTTHDTKEMEDAILNAMWLCEQNGNKHLIKFMKLLYNHLDGIVTHAEFPISSGKMEGINNKVKTIRRQAYGYPDDEYFFLKLFDMSRY